MEEGLLVKERESLSGHIIGKEGGEESMVYCRTHGGCLLISVHASSYYIDAGWSSGPTLTLQHRLSSFDLHCHWLQRSLLWIFLERILCFVGQDPLISHEAGIFAVWYIPALFGYGTLQPLIRYFQMQSMIFPMLISSCSTICFHIPVCWALVYKSGLQSHGAALAMGLSMWMNVIILVLFIRFSSLCEKTRAPFSREVFIGIKEFFQFAVPSAVMMCLSWWSFEVMVLSSGPNPQLETSVLSVCLNILVTVYAVPFGLAAAVSTRVSNELGAGNPEGARVAVITTILLSLLEVLIVDIALISARHALGYLFSSDSEVVDYVTTLAPLVCFSVLMDSLPGVLAGVARGCGWQYLGAYVNLAAFYLFGIPLALTLGFMVKLRGRGLWIGILSGASLQCFLLAIITIFTNWEKQAMKARERLFQERNLVAVIH